MVLDTDLARRQYAMNPVEHLLSALAAGMLKGIERVTPMLNAFVESLNRKLRDECLNLHWFGSLRHAREEIERWRSHYNAKRPHAALGY